jgi:hypothetical protein
MRENRFVNTLKKLGRFSQNILWGLTLAVLVIGWLAISGLNLYCAINLSCDPASLTWWSMFLSVFGLPILAVQMYLLRKTIEEGTWKPNISIGFLTTTPEPDDIMNLDELPQKATVHYNDFMSLTKIIIRNSGKSAAKNIKIQVSLIEYPTQPSIPEMQLDKSKHLSTMKVLVANLETVVHPGDFNEFIFAINSDQSRKLDELGDLLRQCSEYLNGAWQSFSSTPDLKKYPYWSKNYNEIIATAEQFSRLLIIGKYLFEVKVWADGINPVCKKIILEVADYPDEIKFLIKEIALEAERYFEHRADDLPLSKNIG